MGHSFDKELSDKPDLRKTVWILVLCPSWLLRQMCRRAAYIFHRPPVVWILPHREVQLVQPNYVLGLEKEYNLFMLYKSIYNFINFDKYSFL